MTQEEKAKAYDEAIERAKFKIKNDKDHVLYEDDIVELFPALKESEDEKTKRILHSISSKMSFHLRDIFTEEEFQCFDAWSNAWLEKQVPINEEAEKEKNDYVSGQFLYCKGSFNEFKEGESYWIEYIGNDTYIGRSDNILNRKFHITPRQLYTWLDPRHPEKQNEQKPHLELKAGHWYICHRAFCCRADHLTVKEGERFLCEKDGVAKGFVIKEPEKYFKEVCALAPIEDEQKPAWSEEDEINLEKAIWYVENPAPMVVKDSMLVEWLKSLRPQNTWKPSEEQMDALRYVTNFDYGGYKATLVSLYEQLKKL